MKTQMTNKDRNWAGKTYLEDWSGQTVGQHGVALTPYDNGGRKIGTLLACEKRLYLRPANGKKWSRVRWNEVFQKLLAAIMIVAGLSLGACASNMAWYSPSRTLPQAEQDFRECKYDAAKYGYVPNQYFGLGDPVAAGITAGIEQAMRTNGVIRSCMESKGYTLQNIRSIQRTGGAVIRNGHVVKSDPSKLKTGDHYIPGDSNVWMAD